MKHETLIYSIGSIIVIIAAALKILHLPFSDYANSLQVVAFIGMFFYQAWHIAQLKKKIKEMQDK